MNDDDALPTPLEHLRSHLLEVGFEEVTNRHHPESFGNRLVLLNDSILLVRMLHDRKQWFLEVGIVGISDVNGWHQAQTWRECLEHSGDPFREPLLVEQAEFVAKNLNRMRESATDERDRTTACLTEVTRRRSRHWIKAQTEAFKRQMGSG